MTNLVTLRREPDLRPCDTEPSDIAQGGMVVPTLRPEDCTFLGRVLNWFPRRKEPTAFHKCLAVHMGSATAKARSALS